MLLTVLMVMSLFSGMSISAYADDTAVGNTVKYTMVEGDYVLRICQRLGLNFETCKAAIMKLNNITESQWTKLAVGRVLTLPASDSDAIAIMGGAAVSTGSTGTAGASTAAGNNSVSGDPVAYYMIPYTMQSGDTVAGVCNALGIKFASYADQIKAINGIGSWSNIKAGTQILLPVATKPAVGTSCIAVLAHKVGSGETAYSICAANGINYAGNTKVLQALNNNNNLASIKAGSTFYLPVATTITAATSSTGSTTTSGSSAAATPTSSTNTTTTTTDKSYKLSSNISSAAGTLQFYVDNKVATTAKEGEKVTVVVDTLSGKAIDSLTVKYADGSADLLLTGDTFIMPACDVRVDVAIKKGHDINIQSNYANMAVANVGGVAVTSATKGSSVMIVSTDPTYTVAEAYVSYRTMMGDKKDAVTNLSQGFVMPDADVTVEVVLKPVPTFAFYVDEVPNGSYFLQVNGSNVTRAAKGADVTIVTKAQDGYTPTEIKVVKHGDDTVQVSVFNNTFSMPGFDVDVTVTFGSKGNNIVVNPVEGGIFYAVLNSGDDIDKAVSDAGTNVEVYIKSDKVEAGYTDDPENYIVTRNSDGLRVKTPTAGQFTMPAGGVTITGAFKAAENEITGMLYLDGSNVTAYSSVSFYAQADGRERTEFKLTSNPDKAKAGVGEYVNLSFAANDAIGFERYVVKVGGAVDEDLTNQANLNGYFKMPNEAVTVEAYFTAGKMNIGSAVVKGLGTVSYMVDGKSVSTCKSGDTVVIALDPAKNYSFDYKNYEKNLIVSRKDTGAQLTVSKYSVKPDEGKFWYSFVIPAEGVDIVATFDPAAYKLSMKTVDEKGNDLTGKGIWTISVNGGDGIAENSATDVDLSYNDGVVVAMTDAGKADYDMISFKINGWEYISYVKNESYNFRVSELRALYDPIEVVATVRPKTVTNNAKPFNLSASYDASKGNVEFLILESPSGYSTVDTTKFVKQAYAGDKVAIVFNSTSDEYTLDENSIKVYGDDATVIVPSADTTSISGKTVYTFIMPQTGCRINASFTAVAYNVEVNVTGGDGLVKVSAGSEFRDVLAADSFNAVGFGTTVKVLRTEYAKAQAQKIESIEVLNGSDKVPVAEIADGYQFTMPAGDVVINVTIGDDATLKPITLKYETANGKLVFYSDADCKNIITAAKPGETVYVKASAKEGYQLKDGSLKILNAADNTIIGDKGTSTDDFDYKFEMPAKGVKPAAEFEAIVYEVKINSVTADNVAQLTVSGQPAVVVKAGDTVKVPYGSTVSLSLYDNTSYKDPKMTSATAGFTNGTSFKMPNGDVTDLSITLTAK